MSEPVPRRVGLVPNLVFLFGRGTYLFLAMSGQFDPGAHDEYGIVCGIMGWSRGALALLPAPTYQDLLEA